MSDVSARSQAPASTLESYLQTGIHTVDGWCDPRLWQVIEPLARPVAEATKNAPIAEIGVFHGKFFIGLALTMGAASGNTAFDVFDMQEFNQDNAGEGNLQVFLDHTAKHGVPREAITIERTDSTWITATERHEIVARQGKFSMFSVDGCHTAAHTMRDMQLAMDLTDPAGLIFLDDYHNDFWPGVQEGVAKMFFTGAPAFVPLVYLCNKLVFCNVAYHQRNLGLLRNHMGRHHPDSRRKTVERYGVASLSIRPSAKGRALAAPPA